MTGFTGVLEQREGDLQDFKESRLRRLREVRLQEKNLSADRCNTYRRVIGIRKQLKTEIIKDALISKKKILHDKLTVKWQSSLVDTGNAHRTATEVSLVNVNRKLADNASDAQKRTVAEQRGRDATQERHREAQEQRRLIADRLEQGSLRAVAIASDREDARATAEARVAKFARKTASMMQEASDSAHLQRSSNVVMRALQSAVRIQDRGPVLRDTNVVRHGRVHGYELTSKNEAAVEGRNALAKQWGTVMREMLHRRATASRALAARQDIASMHRAEELQVELALLSQADKATCRASKARNAASVRAVPHDAAPVAVRAFEREFMSTSNIFEGAALSKDIDIDFSAEDGHHHGVAAIDASYDRPLPASLRQPKIWDEELVAINPRRLAPDSVRISQNSFDALVVRSSTASQQLTRPPPAWSVPLDEGEGTRLAPSTADRDRIGKYTASMPSPLVMDNIPVNWSPPKVPLPQRVTDLFLPQSPSPFSEESSLFQSEVGGADQIERSTSTANTLAARHDYAQTLSPSQQRPIQLGRGRQFQGDRSTSSSQSSGAFSPSEPVSRSSSAPFSRQLHGTSDAAFPRTSQQSTQRDEEEDESESSGFDPLGVSVRLRTVPATGADGSRRQDPTSEESFEEFYDDDQGAGEGVGEEGEEEEDDEDSEDLSLHWVRSRVVPSSGGAHDSVRSSGSPLGGEEGRESEADDNMSAITWPDLTSRKVLSSSYSKGLRSDEMQLRSSGGNRGRNNDKDDEEEEGGEEGEEEEEEAVRGPVARMEDSMEGDGFLQELDALSLSWMQRRKVLQDKDRWSER